MSRRPIAMAPPALHGASAASMMLMVAPAAGAAKADELGGELLALLAEAKRLCEEWQQVPLEDVAERLGMNTPAVRAMLRRAMDD